MTGLPAPARPCFAPIWQELGSALRFLRPAGPATAVAPAGDLDGTPVLLIPGFLAGDGSLSRLAAHLAAAGHRPCGAGIERNVDCSETLVGRLLERLEQGAARDRRHVIVGHSRGGLLARVMARRRPDLVAGVVLLGAPHRDQLAIHPLLWAQALTLATAGTLGVRGLLRLGCAAGACCADFRSDLRAPLPPQVARLAIYSRSDGVVDWRACLDPDGRHVEVRTSHCGMTEHAPTLHLIARTVAAFGAPARIRPHAGGLIRADAPLGELSTFPAAEDT